MKISKLLFVAFLAKSSLCLAQSNERIPRIGYAYPAGGQQGTRFEIVVGGQYLRGIEGVHVSGEGVMATSVTELGRESRLSREQRLMIQVKMMELNSAYWKLFYEKGLFKKEEAPWEGRLEKMREQLKSALEKADEEIKWPNHYYLRDLEDKDPYELSHAQSMISFDRKKIQPNAQIEELAVINIQIDPDAPVGERELRLQLRQGLTNAVVFKVGDLPETREAEPNDPQSRRGFLPEPVPLTLPLTFNGQIMPGDVDCFTFNAKAGQQIVIDADARELVPFLADAVPGWFQAVVRVLDSEGTEIAYADDFHFDPDPVMLFDPPADGIYTLEIRDSIYRGRQDFVYRVTLSERPYVTNIFPLGVKRGSSQKVKLSGWNLKREETQLAATSLNADVETTCFMNGGALTNPVTFAVSEMDAIIETEPNNVIEQAQTVDPAHIIEGRINRDDDKDVFRFTAKKGQNIVAEINARRLRSPLDSLVQILDASGKVLAWNDDVMDMDGFLHRDMGLQTDHADSYLIFEAPADGVYYARISDTRGHGGDAFAYRLRLSAPRPEFQVITTPSVISQRVGSMLIDVYVLRRDGFNEPIELSLAEGTEDFTLQGATIPAGANHVRMTLTKTSRREGGVEAVRLLATAKLGDAVATKTAQPADDCMQAFLWRHLAPSDELLVQSRRWGGGIQVQYDGEGSLQISPGQSIELTVPFKRTQYLKDMVFELFDAPEGVTIKEGKNSDKGTTLILAADSDKAKPGSAKNLIIEGFRIQETGKPDKDGNRPIRRSSAGYLPAIPFKILE